MLFRQNEREIVYIFIIIFPSSMFITIHSSTFRIIIVMHKTEQPKILFFSHFIIVLRTKTEPETWKKNPLNPVGCHCIEINTNCWFYYTFGVCVCRFVRSTMGFALITDSLLFRTFTKQCTHGVFHRCYQCHCSSFRFELIYLFSIIVITGIFYYFALAHIHPSLVYGRTQLLCAMDIVCMSHTECAAWRTKTIHKNHQESIEAVLSLLSTL